MCIFLYLLIYLFCCSLCVRVCSFLCSDSLLYIYFFIFLSILHGVYTRDCSYIYNYIGGALSIESMWIFLPSHVARVGLRPLC